jgi:hypothetical protein
MFGTTTTVIRVEILKILKDGKIRKLDEILKLVAKRTNAKLTTERYAPDKNQHDTKWVKRIKWDLTWLKDNKLIENPRKSVFKKNELREMKFKGMIGKFRITKIGKNVLALILSYKKQTYG